MRYLEFFKSFIKENGLVGTCLLLLLADRVGIFRILKKYFNKEPELRIHKRDGDEGDEHLHRREISQESKVLSELVVKFNSHQDQFKAHLDKFAAEEIKMAVLINDVGNTKERARQTDENVEKLFNLVSNLKDAMIAMGYGGKK